LAMPADRQLAEELAELRGAHLEGVALPVGADVPEDPGNVRFLGAAAVVAQADGRANAVEEARLRRSGWAVFVGEEHATPGALGEDRVRDRGTLMNADHAPPGSVLKEPRRWVLAAQGGNSDTGLTFAVARRPANADPAIRDGYAGLRRQGWSERAGTSSARDQPPAICGMTNTSLSGAIGSSSASW
jgi:hypothetical protein